MARRFAWLLAIFLFLGGFDAHAASGPSAEKLATDLETIHSQILEVKEEMEKYRGGLILTLLTSRREILKNTRAMLEQRQSSWLKMISLDYTIDGKPQPKVTSEQLESLLSDIAKLEQKINNREQETAKYSGGLILMTILSTLETQKMGLAALRMRYLTAKHGIPIFGVEGEPVKQGSEQPIGEIVRDEEAL